MSIAEKLTIIAENEQKVFDAGKQAEYDRFWDVYQGNGTRRGYSYAFRGWGWTDDTFKPKYPIIATGNLEAAFRETRMTSLNNVDTSGVTSFNTTFYNTDFTTIDKVDVSKGTNLTSAFAQSSVLHTIGELVVSEVTVFASTTFGNCLALKNLNITGTIATNFTCSNSKLTHDSLMSIINALKDYSATGGTHTCTIGSTNLAKLTDAEKAIATQKGWTVA